MSLTTVESLVGLAAWDALQEDAQLLAVLRQKERTLHTLGVSLEERGYAIGFLQGVRFVLGLPEARRRERKDDDAPAQLTATAGPGQQPSVR